MAVTKKNRNDSQGPSVGRPRRDVVLGPVTDEERKRTVQTLHTWSQLGALYRSTAENVDRLAAAILEKYGDREAVTAEELQELTTMAMFVVYLEQTSDGCAIAVGRAGVKIDAMDPGAALGEVWRRRAEPVLVQAVHLLLHFLRETGASIQDTPLRLQDILHSLYLPPLNNSAGSPERSAAMDHLDGILRSVDFANAQLHGPQWASCFVVGRILNVHERTIQRRMTSALAHSPRNQQLRMLLSRLSTAPRENKDAGQKSK